MSKNHSTTAAELTA